METTFVIYIGIYQMLGVVAAIVAGAWYLSSRLTRIETKLESFDVRMTNLEGRQSNTFLSASPISLQPQGVRALEDSGLKEWIDTHKEQLFKKCSAQGQMENPYDIQQAVFMFFDELDFGEFEPRLKEAAFNYGLSIEVMRRVGAIYFRDLCLIEKGFKPEDLDPLL